MGDRFLLIGGGLRSLMALSTAEIIRDIASWNRESKHGESLPKNLDGSFSLIEINNWTSLNYIWILTDFSQEGNLYSLMICVYISCRIKYRKFNIWKMIISQKLLFRANKIRWRRRERGRGRNAASVPLNSTVAKRICIRRRSILCSRSRLTGSCRPDFHSDIFFPDI